jgi:hypothetical protein
MEMPMFNKFNTVFALAAAAAIAFGGITAANSATIDVAGVSGNWTSLLPPTGPTNVKGLNTNSVSWGTVHSTSTTGKQSGYSFVGAAAGTQESGVDFDLGTFTHNNFVINAGTSIESARLGLVVNLVIGGVSRAISTSFGFNHWETNNNGERNGRCANGGANGSGVNSAGCADRVTIVDNRDQQERFEIDGILYILEITGFTQAGALFSEFWTTENAANSAVLRARFTAVGTVPGPGPGPGPNPNPNPNPEPSPVPLPAAAWLMLTGLGALAAARARRRVA